MLFLTAPSASIILLPIEQSQAEGFVRRNGGTAIISEFYIIILSIQPVLSKNAG